MLIDQPLNPSPCLSCEEKNKSNVDLFDVESTRLGRYCVTCSNFYPSRFSSSEPSFSFSLHLPAPPPLILCVPLFLSSSANKLCMPSQLTECCTAALSALNCCSFSLPHFTLRFSTPLHAPTLLLTLNLSLSLSHTPT